MEPLQRVLSQVTLRPLQFLWPPILSTPSLGVLSGLSASLGGQRSQPLDCLHPLRGLSLGVRKPSSSHLDGFNNHSLRRSKQDGDAPGAVQRSLGKKGPGTEQPRPLSKLPPSLLSPGNRSSEFSKFDHVWFSLVTFALYNGTFHGSGTSSGILSLPRSWFFRARSLQPDGGYARTLWWAPQ